MLHRRASRDELNTDLNMTLINIEVQGSHFDASDLSPLDASVASRPLRMLDPGFSRTASCRSAITYLDGDAGELRYRGYDVAELAESVSFEAVCHLLLHRELPSVEELSELKSRAELGVPSELRQLASNLGAKCHPMLAMQAVAAAMGGHLPNREPGDAGSYRRSMEVFLSWWPQLAGDIHRASLGLPPVLAPIGSYAERVLTASGLPHDEATVRAMEVLLVCHADHEQNCSTTTARTAASAHADVFATVSAALGSLSGPLHGGANEAVIHQLGELSTTGRTGAELVADVEAGKLRLMGFGHRVYKNYDPRARIIRHTADAVFKARGEHPLLQLALEVEHAALESEYFKARKLYPNVDFFSGLVYDVIGFDRSFFTVLFALGRIPGWLAHAAEQLEDPTQRIVRPLQVFNGVPARNLA
jgi:citrate synthase